MIQILPENQIHTEHGFGYDTGFNLMLGKKPRAFLGQFHHTPRIFLVLVEHQGFLWNIVYTLGLKCLSILTH